MKRTWIIILGTLNIVVCVLLILWHYNTAVKYVWRENFTWPLPILIAALFALISGIITLKRGVLVLAIISLVAAGAASIYYFILLLVVSWTMS